MTHPDDKADQMTKRERFALDWPGISIETYAKYVQECILQNKSSWIDFEEYNARVKVRGADALIAALTQDKAEG